jgi:DNA polymerase-3 subunit gamma/tau
MLYRKWRPRTFAEVVGQGHVVQTLRNGLRSGRVAHAYLFAGPRGTGKTMCARLLAKAVNCLGAGDDPPCGECAICRAVDEGRLLDLIEIDAASNTGVDDVRELQEKVGFQPAQAKYKVYAIDEVHMLSNAAFNALLKTLEEPPPHTIFVLATTEPHKLPATVVSRCQRFAFRPIAEADIVAHLAHVAEAEGMEAEQEALSLIARHATGALRDGLSLLEQVASGGPVTVERVREVLGLVPEEGTLAVLEAVAAGTVGETLSALAALLEGGRRRARRAPTAGRPLARRAGHGGRRRGTRSIRPRIAGRGGRREAAALAVGAGGDQAHGADDRTGLELALVRAVIGPQVAPTPGLVTALSEETQGQAVPRLSPRSSRQAAGPPATEHQSERSTGDQARVDRQPAQADAGRKAAVPEPSPSPTIPRRLDALQAHWGEVLAGLGRSGHVQIQALLRSCTPLTTGLPLELADDPLLRVAVQELGAVVRTP